MQKRGPQKVKKEKLLLSKAFWGPKLELKSGCSLGAPFGGVWEALGTPWEPSGAKRGRKREPKDLPKRVQLDFENLMFLIEGISK